jgi:hypothetical protein
VHGAAAVLFFICISAMSVFCSGETLQYLPPGTRQKYKRAYIFLACVMLGSPVLAYVFNESIFGHTSYAFWVEFTGIYAFGLYWLVKTKEISILKKARDARKFAGLVKTEDKGSAEIPADAFF